MKLAELKKVNLKDVTNEDSIKFQDTSRDDIAIIGISGRFAEADNLKEYWNILKNGRDCIRKFPEDRADEISDYMEKMYSLGLSEEGIKFIEAGFLNNVDQFDYNFFGLSPREASLMDPNQRIFLETVWSAIEDAGYDTKKIRGTKTGIYLGFSNDLQDDYTKYVQTMSPESIGVSIAGNIKSIIASRISYLLDFKGPSMVVDTACSSALVAVHLACQSIRKGECDTAIAGGVKVILCPIRGEASWGIGTQSSDFRCKTFDNSSDGIGLGEGAGVVILKPLYKALNDGDNIHAVIKGSAINQDGNSLGLTTPNPIAQEEVIIKAWEDSHINPESISYIESHGTGTKLGDPIEISGIQRAFKKYTDKKQFCAIGSVKANVGHLDCCSGIASMMKVILALKNKKLPPSINFKTPNSKISFEESPVYVNDRFTDWKSDYPLRCGISSFGLSGTNCHIVLEEAPEIKKNQKEEPNQGLNVLTISAKNMESLKELIVRYNEFFNEKSDKVSMDDILYTANAGRTHFNYRLAILFDSVEDIKNKLATLCLVDLNENFLNPKGIYFGEVKFVENGRKKHENELTTEEKIDMKNKADEKLKIYASSKESQSEVLGELCKLYTNGADINWEKVYENKKVTRVSLPTYPFLPKICWVKSRVDNKEKLSVKEVVKNISKHQHPLLDKLLVKSMNIEMYSTMYTPEKYWVLNEHKVNGKYVVPGTTYLEIALAACQKYFEEKRIELKDFIFLTPLIVNDGECKEVHTIIRQEGEYYVVSVASRMESDNDEIWVKYAEGKVMGVHSKPERTYDIEILKKKFRSEKVINFDEIPVNAIEVGPRWKSLKTVAFGDDEILAKVELPEAYIEDMNAYVMHPSLMDIAMNVLIRNVGEGLYLPWSYKSLKRYKPLPDKFYSYIRKKGIHEQGMEVAAFDVTLIGFDGEIIAEVEDYLVKKVHEKDFKLGETLDKPIDSYEILWKPQTLKMKNQSLRHQNILVLKGEHQVSNRIMSALSDLSANLIEVDFGSNYLKISEAKYVVNGTEEDFKRLFFDLNGIEFSQILNFMSLNNSNEIASVTEFNLALDKGVYTLFNLTKAILESKITNNIEIISIADYGYQVTKNESVIKPHNASLYGISKVIGNEYSNLICKCIDIDVDTEVKDILAELSTNNQVPIVAYRQGVRYIEEFNISDTDNAPVKEIKIKQDGVYIITGGTGGIGLEIGKYLASIEKINLVFINRSSLPERSKWPKILEENMNNKVCNIIKHIMDIECEGTKVILYRGDVSNESDMKGIFGDLKKKFYKIDGVIHCAGVAGDGFIIRKEKKKFEEVLLPKTLGTWLLDKMTEDQNLEFFINFSSINTLYGIPGQSDYNAANAYLDSFSEYRNKKNKRTITINWSGWKETGMAFNFKVDENKSMFKALSTEKALKAFDNVLQRDIRKIIIGELNYEAIDTFINQYTIRISDNLRSFINKKLKMKKENYQKNSRKKEEISEVVIKGKAKNNINEFDLKLAQIWGKVLGITEVDINDDFYDIGGDSILATDLLRYLEKEFKDLVNIVDVFTYSTIDKMSKYLNIKINKKETIDVEERIKENKKQVLERISKIYKQSKIYIFNDNNIVFTETVSNKSGASNCYVWGDGKDCVVIDPGIDADIILNATQQASMNIKYIILTHCHIDHIMSVKKLMEKTGAQLMIPKEDADLLKYIVKPEHIFISRYLKNDDQINIGNLKLKVIHVGGHTKGSICFKSEQQLFTGDVLFKLSIGNSDKEWGGSYSQIIESIKNKLFMLKDEINIFPGHGEPTTVGYEKKNNPFIKLDYTK